MPRRYKKNKIDSRVICLGGISFFIFLTYRLPGFGFFSGTCFAAISLLLWLIGAQRQRIAIHQWKAVSNMYTLSPEIFEKHVASTFESLGYKVKLTPRVGDQGVDVLAERQGERIAIQCKRSNEPVPNAAVQEVHAGRSHYQCSRAIVVALGGFTTSARTLSISTKVELLDGAAYADLFHRALGIAISRPIWSVLPRGRILQNSLICAALAVISFIAGSISTTAFSK